MTVPAFCSRIVVPILVIGAVSVGAGETVSPAETRLPHSQRRDQAVTEIGVSGPGATAPRARNVARQRDAVVIETAEANFGEVLLGEQADISQAIVARVISSGRWRLWLVREQPVQHENGKSGGESLRWRTPAMADFSTLQGGRVVVAQGGPTEGHGALVPIDLRLEFGDDLPMGRYTASLRLHLEPLGL